MIIVTGGAGFIGSQLIKALNAHGRDDIVVVDNLTNGRKFYNLVDCDILDYIDKDDFLETLDDFENVDAIFHQGACSVTTEWDGRYMMQNNYEYSKELLHYAIENEVPFLYASSAAIYGGATAFSEDVANERPLNVYGYSKLLFDRYVRKLMPQVESQIVGLRYFNVYGPGEAHKGSMASVAFHFNNQIKQDGVAKLFGPCDGYEAGQQERDFIHVSDVVNVNLWLWAESNFSGIVNVGTGRAQTFNEVAQAVIDYHGKGDIQYVDFPEHLKGAYQSFTQADLTQLRETGYDKPFKTVQEGVAEYLEIIG